MTEPPGDKEPQSALLKQMLEDANAQAGRAVQPEATPPLTMDLLLGNLPEEPQKSLRETLLADIDALVSAQVDEVLSHPDVQARRLAWQGLRELVDQLEFGANVQLEFLSCTKEELFSDFEGANGVTASALYRRLCDSELSSASEPHCPVSLIVTDFEFGPYQREVELLSHCAAVAADAHAPFIANASPRFFRCERFADLATLGDLRHVLESPRYAAWQSFRKTEDARYVALCIPGASRMFALQVAASFAKHRRFDALTGATPSGLGPDGLRLTEEAERDLSDGGFITLTWQERAGSCFLSTRSSHQPKRFADTREGRAAARDGDASAQLANTLMISRLAHFIEAIAAELLPDIDTSDLERALQQWLSHFASELGAGKAHVTVTEPGYLRYELAIRDSREPEGGTLLVAGRLD